MEISIYLRTFCVIVVVFHLILCVLARSCTHDHLPYPTSWLIGNSSYSRRILEPTTSYDGFFLLKSPNSNFLLALTTCRLVIAHNDTNVIHTIVWQATFSTCALKGDLLTISFLSHGELVVLLSQNTTSTCGIAYPKQVQVWNTNTSGKGAKEMHLMDNGNLILVNAQNIPIWQSFDHPSSMIISSQTLTQGMNLVLSKGFLNFSLVIEPSRVVLYAIDIGIQDPMPYWELLPNSSSNATIAFIALDNMGNFQLFDLNKNPLVLYNNVMGKNLNIDEVGIMKFVDGEDMEAITTSKHMDESNLNNTLVKELGVMEFKRNKGMLGFNLDGKVKYNKNMEKNPNIKVNDHNNVLNIVEEFNQNGSHNPNTKLQVSNLDQLWRAEISKSGNVEIYEWRHGMAHWEIKENVIKDSCELPTSCGRFTTCNHEKTCKCMEPFVDRAGECEMPPNIGVVLEDWCAMLSSKSCFFMELRNTSMYFAIKFEQGYTTTLMECQEFCMQNCSCFAFIFNNNSFSCIPLLYPNRTTFIAPTSLSFVANNHSSFFLKVNTSSSPHQGNGRSLSNLALWLLLLFSNINQIIGII